MRSLVAALWALASLLRLQQRCSSADVPIVVIDLSSKNLSVVPEDLPCSVEHLDLSLNQIRRLGAGDFEGVSRLRFLNLSWNGIEEINPGVFAGTPLLEDLDLSHNSLQNLSDQPYLLHTQNIRALNLAFNQFSNMSLGREFRGLAVLRRLAVGGRNIRTDDFANIAGLELQTLTLCLDLGVKYAAGSLTCVRAERLSIVMPKRQILWTLDSLVEDALRLFDEVEMTGLKCGYPDIAKQLGKRGQLKTSHLYLTDTVLQWTVMTDFLNAFLQGSVPKLTITNMALHRLPFNDSYICNSSTMESLTLRRVTVMSFFFDQASVYNFIINMPIARMAVLETPMVHMTCPRFQSPLRFLDFSDCSLSDTIFSRVEGGRVLECETFGQLTRLILRGNNLKDFRVLSARLRHMTSLSHLDVSLNDLSHEGQAECTWPSSLAYVNLSSNGLSDSIFTCLPRGARELDLRNNQVCAVPSGPTLRLLSLEVLDLSSNRLKELPVCAGFPALLVLLLNANALHTPSVANLRGCPKLQSLDVRHNPFTCTCALRSFRSLAIESERQGRVKLPGWPGGYCCSYPEALRNSTLKDFGIPEINCNVGLLAASILVPAVLVVVAVASVCHRLDIPWYVGMICQWVTVKRRAKRRRDQLEDKSGVEYHAFVSYSEHDADWVMGSLLPHLQGPAGGGGLRVCHHRESFLPGRTIPENILRSVEKSWRCVFVLSSHFVKSEWCHYELYFASQQHLHWGSDRVVLVLLEPVPQYLIPSKYHQLKSLMSKHTYLEWPQTASKHRFFWANLRAALDADLPDATAARGAEGDGGVLEEE